MNHYEKRIDEAASKQMYANYHDVHIANPFADHDSQQRLSKENKKGDNFTVRLPSLLRKDLTEISELEGISISQLINNAIAYAILKYYDCEEARKIYTQYANKWKNEPPQINDSLKDMLENNNPSQPNVNSLRDLLERKDS